MPLRAVANRMKIPCGRLLPGCRTLAPLVFFCLCIATLWTTTEVRAFEGKLNINSATASQFEQLPFIGKARAAAIIRARQNDGPFHNTREIQQAAGIGKNTFQAIAPFLSLTGDNSALLHQTAATETARDDSSPPPITMHHPGRFPVHDNELLLLLDKDYYPTLLGALENAQSEISVAMFLFKTTNSARNRPAKVLAALVAAKKRGVRIEVVLEKSSYDKELNRENKKAARLLENKGIRVRFDRGRVTTHTKLVVIDRRYSFIGSHNLTEAALDYNHEVSLMVDDRGLAKKLLQYIERL